MVNNCQNNNGLIWTARKNLTKHSFSFLKFIIFVEIEQKNDFNGSTRGSLFAPEKCLKESIPTWWACFENPILLHSIFSSKTMITCPNPILLHFSKVRISDFAPISIRSKNLAQNRKFELLKSGAKSELDTWSQTSKRNCPEQNRIFEQGPSRDNELLQTLFRSKKGTPAYRIIYTSLTIIISKSVFRSKSVTWE